MFGGPSHLDTFDPKPLLLRDSGRPLPQEKRPRVVSFPNRMGNLVGSAFEFGQHGESGLAISSLFPHLAQRADDLCVINSMHCSNSRHGGAVLEWHTGSDTFIRPSFGSWVTYGLGSENQDFPGYVTICQDLSQGGANNFGSAFLPAVYQGTTLGYAGERAADARIPFLGRRLGDTRIAASRAGLDRRDGSAPGNATRAGLRAGCQDLLVRAGLPDASPGTGDARYRGRIKRHRAPLRPRRRGDGRLRHAVFAGATACRSAACVSCNATWAAGIRTRT